MHHLIRLQGAVDRAMYDLFKSSLEKIQEGAVYVFISSTGGELEYARKISNLIFSRQTTIQVVGIGYHHVYSSALHIFMACTYRVDYAHTRYLLHLPSSDGSVDGDRGVELAQQEEVEYFTRMTRRPKELIKSLMIQEVYLDSRQAYHLGITNFVLKKESKFLIR
jgi:ATP-dependent protease ClpP protease subunit